MCPESVQNKKWFLKLFCLSLMFGIWCLSAGAFLWTSDSDSSTRISAAEHDSVSRYQDRDPFGIALLRTRSSGETTLLTGNGRNGGPHGLSLQSRIGSGALPETGLTGLSSATERKFAFSNETTLQNLVDFLQNPIRAGPAA